MRDARNQLCRDISHRLLSELHCQIYERDLAPVWPVDARDRSLGACRPSKSIEFDYVQACRIAETKTMPVNGSPRWRLI
jgi:hypothetical protein